MGFLSRAKESEIGTEAQRAYDEGQARFAARLNFPMTHHGLSGEIPDWSKQIEAIERIGWCCEFFSVAQDFKGRPEAYVLFGRG